MDFALTTEQRLIVETVRDETRARRATSSRVAAFFGVMAFALSKKPH